MNNKKFRPQLFKKIIILIKVIQKKLEKEKDKKERERHLKWQERKINKLMKNLEK